MAGLLDFLRGTQAQMPGQPAQMNPLQRLFQPEVALPMAAALLGGQGNAANFGNAFGVAGQVLGQQKQLQAQTAQKNRTIDLFQREAPDIAQAIESGGVSVEDGWKAYMRRREVQKSDPYKVVGGQVFNTEDQSWITPPGGQNDDAAQRSRQAEQFGLSPEDPRYQAFVLTGKFPREDAQSLTAVDKKAILEADEMVSANQNAIAALDQAAQISDNANSGYLAGTRATIGNNLPDWLVPDVISSPESSVATTDMDNAVIGQALASLKTIFGGNPTEGERSILLQLQGSSSMPKEVRRRVFARAKELAQKRLAFNQQRADQLRGGTFYQNGQGMSQPPTATPQADPLGIR